MTLLTSLSMTFTASAAQNISKSTIMHRLPVDVTDTGGTLIFSDSPEYVRKNGILYADTVKGAARILFYHLNDTGVKKKLAIIVENVYPVKNKIEITRGGFALPDDNFLSVGKATQTLYMQDDFHDTITLEKGERGLFQAEMNNVTIEPQHLIYGVYDFTAEKPVKISVMMYPYNVDPLKFFDSAKILPKDEHKLRGTFKRMNRNFRLRKEYNPETDGICYVTIGDNKTDFFKKGIDATDGEEVVNYGNYGINYILEFRMKSETRFVICPLGGYYAGAIRFHYNGSTGIIQTPNNKLYFGEKRWFELPSLKKLRIEGKPIFDSQLEVSDIGIYDGNVKFEYSPPGASNLPVNIILIPGS